MAGCGWVLLRVWLPVPVPAEDGGMPFVCGAGVEVAIVDCLGGGGDSEIVRDEAGEWA